MKSFFVILFFICCAVLADAQTFVVSGRVTNDVSGAPMAAASVFAQNTTMGTVTDADGNFRLELPNGGYDLVISFTGYKAISRRISSSDAPEKINVALQLKEKELEEVAVVSSNEVADGDTKYGAFFRDEFLGRLGDSNVCRIQNPEVLHFFFSKRRNRLKVKADAPLQIDNRLLGYHITYTLDSFVHEYNTQAGVYSGYPLFEEMTGSSEEIQRWRDARHTAYLGSELHFMRSLYNQSLSADKFEVRFIIHNLDKNDDALTLKNPYGALNFKKDDSTQTVEIVPNQPNVGVLFTAAKPPRAYISENPDQPAGFQFSLLTFRGDAGIVIERNGYFYDQDDVTVSGYWAWQKVAEQLPYDYHFTEE